MAFANPCMNDPNAPGCGGSSGASSGSSTGGCPPGGCVNVYTPDDTTDSSSSGSSGNCESGCAGKHRHPAETHEPDPPRVYTMPAQPPPPPAPVEQPVQPQQPGGDFVPPGTPTAPAQAPVLNEQAVSRDAAPAVDVAPASQLGAEPAGTGAPWQWIIPAVAVLVGAALTLAPLPPSPAAGTAPPPMPLPPPFTPPPPNSPILIPEFPFTDAGGGVHLPWQVYSDSNGQFTLAQHPGGPFTFQEAGPFATFPEGAAAMAALGVPGWP
jgi:hypothetical protein